nr:CopG family transcriptional regulator [Rhodoferax sp.]
MKNVTITVEDAALEWARIEAAKRNTSVSRLVGAMLSDKMRHDDAYSRAMHEWMADSSFFESNGQPYPTREEIYAERLDRFR